MNLLNLLFFGLAVMGLTNILVDPAEIFLPVRNAITWIIDKLTLKDTIKLRKVIIKPGLILKFIFKILKLPFVILDKILSCYQCCGTWTGFFCGYCLIDQTFLGVLMCGFAGSFIANWGAMYLNYLQAKTIVD